MKVIEVSESGGPEVLRLADRPVPTLRNGEVLIRVRAIGMNHADLAQRHGLYPPPDGSSDLLGLEVAGDIAEVGKGVARWRVGDRVCALMSGGGYAEYATAHSSLCLPIPKRLNYEQAAVLPEAFATVWLNVFVKSRLQEGERLLVHGGASGIGVTAIQLASNLGSEVWVTAGSDEKCAACQALGAHRTINYKTEDFEKVIRDQDIRMNVVLDMVGGSHFSKNLHILARGGRMAYIAALGGRKVELDLVEMMMKRVSIYGTVLRPLSLQDKSQVLSAMEKVVWPMLENGAISPVIYKSFPLESASAAHSLMQSHQHIGKLVLTVQ